MELDWLETFLAVADHGGFTAASAQVHRSQSRVSAHIACLERELNVGLIDRTRRPARLTAAGRVFAGHAREIVAGIGSARSAVGALQAMERDSLSVLTTPCIGTALFPAIIARLADTRPGLRVALAEHGVSDVEGLTADGLVVAVLPTLDHPLAPGLREQVLWREPLQVVVPPTHPWAAAGVAVSAADLATVPLVAMAAAGGAESEVAAQLAERGLAVAPRVVVDTPQTVVAMVGAGVGVGVLNAVALAVIDTSGLVVLDIDGPELIREVAAYWYEVLVTTGVGKVLHAAVLEAELPRGAVPVRPARGAASTGLRARGAGDVRRR